MEKDNEKMVEKTIDVITRFEEANREQQRKEAKPTIEAIREKYKSLSIDNPEDFHAVIGYEQKGICEAAMETYFPEMLENRKIRNAYICWNEIYYLVGKLIETIHGTSACSMDCSRWIANAYLKYCKTGELPDMTITNKTYWKPTFGTAKEWMDYADSIVQLHYGQPIAFATQTVCTFLLPHKS